MDPMSTLLYSIKLFHHKTSLTANLTPLTAGASREVALYITSLPNIPVLYIFGFKCSERFSPVHHSSQRKCEVPTSSSTLLRDKRPYTYNIYPLPWAPTKKKTSVWGATNIFLYCTINTHHNLGSHYDFVGNCSQNTH